MSTLRQTRNILTVFPNKHDGERNIKLGMKDRNKLKESSRNRAVDIRGNSSVWSVDAMHILSIAH